MKRLFLFLVMFSLVSQGQQKLEDLAKLARKYDLLIPDESAELSLVFTGFTTTNGSSSTSHDPGIYAPGFIIKKHSEKKYTVLRGFTEETLVQGDEHIPVVRAFSLEKPEIKLLGHVNRFNGMETFITAIQLACLGRNKDAENLLGVVDREPFFAVNNRHDNISQYKKDKSKLLALCIYNYYCNKSLKRENYKISLKHLVGLEKDFPELFSKNKSDYLKFKRLEFINNLKLSVKAIIPEKGTVEYYLLDWIDKGKETCGCGHFSEHSKDHDEPLRKIFLMGLEAVNELKNLSGDQRLTARVTSAIMNSLESRMRLGEVADEVLEKMVGKNKILINKEVNEKRFFEIASGIEDSPVKKLRQVPLWILGQKYPDSLKSITKKITDNKNSEVSLFNLCECISLSKLSKNSKIELLKSLATVTEGERHRSVLMYLARLDEKLTYEFLSLVLKKFKLKNLSVEEISLQSNYTHVIMDVSSERIWAEYVRVAKEAPVSLRMEMMNAFNYSYIKDKNLSLRIACLASFLKDRTVRQGRARKLWAASIFEKIEVRNFAAMKIASILDFEERPDEFWDEKRWAKLRNKVKDTLKNINYPQL